MSLRLAKRRLTGAVAALVNGHAATARMKHEIYSFLASWSTLSNSFKRRALGMYFDSYKELKSLLETFDRKVLQKH